MKFDLIPEVQSGLRNLQNKFAPDVAPQKRSFFGRYCFRSWTQNNIEPLTDIVLADSPFEPHYGNGLWRRFLGWAEAAQDAAEAARQKGLSEIEQRATARKGLERYVSLRLQDPVTRGAISFAITHLENNGSEAFVGDVTAAPTSTPDQWEIGGGVDPKHTGQGIGTQIWAAMPLLLQEYVRANEVVCVTEPDNSRIATAAFAAGWQDLGIVDEWLQLGGSKPFIEKNKHLFSTKQNPESPSVNQTTDLRHLGNTLLLHDICQRALGAIFADRMQGPIGASPTALTHWLEARLVEAKGHHLSNESLSDFWKLTSKEALESIDELLQNDCAATVEALQKVPLLLTGQTFRTMADMQRFVLQRRSTLLETKNMSLHNAIRLPITPEYLNDFDLYEYRLQLTELPANNSQPIQKASAYSTSDLLFALAVFAVGPAIWNKGSIEIEIETTTLFTKLNLLESGLAQMLSCISNLGIQNVQMPNGYRTPKFFTQMTKI